MRWIGTVVTSGLALTGLLFAVPGSPPAVIDELSDVSTIGSRTGWFLHTDQTPGGASRFVEGPLTPPEGRGSVELSVAATADLALIFAAPHGVTGNLSPWADLSASFSTFTFATTNVEANLPTLGFEGWQSIDPFPTNFTTLSFVGGGANGAAVSGEWQPWAMGPDSTVFQSNAIDGFCIQATPCTLSEFAAAYPTGGWGLVLLGIGSGAPDGARGFADAVKVLDGAEELAYDFEAPAASNSTATIERGAGTSTGGGATVTLTASPLAADSVVFKLTTVLPDGSTEVVTVELAPGETITVPLDLPLGTTQVSVQAQGTDIAAADVTFGPPATTPPPGPASAPSPELAESGADLTPLWGGAALIVMGVGIVIAIRVRRARRTSVD